MLDKQRAIQCFDAHLNMLGRSPKNIGTDELNPLPWFDSFIHVSGSTRPSMLILF